MILYFSYKKIIVKNTQNQHALIAIRIIYKVATLSKVYMKNTEILILGLKSIGQC